MNLGPLVVLGALEHLERGSGYDVDRYLREEQIAQWTELKRASIYHALKALEGAGHVVVVDTQQVKGFPAKTIYAVTPSGLTRFDELQRQAALGLFPRFIGFKLALRLDKRSSPAQLIELARAALARIVELERKLDAQLPTERSEADAARRERDAFFLDHERKLLAAERAWIEAAVARLGQSAE